MHKQDSFFSCKHTQRPTNQLGPPPGHLPCFQPFSEGPEIMIKIISVIYFAKNPSNRKEVTQPGILVVGKFFYDTMKRFPFRGVGLQGAVYWPCIPACKCLGWTSTKPPTPCLSYHHSNSWLRQRHCTQWEVLSLCSPEKCKSLSC